MQPSAENLKPTLYVKSYCPWCTQAMAELKRLDVPCLLINVSEDRAAFEKMIQLSGQSCAPTMTVGEEILADFGPEQVEPFLRKTGLLGDSR